MICIVSDEREKWDASDINGPRKVDDSNCKQRRISEGKNRVNSDILTYKRIYFFMV